MRSLMKLLILSITLTFNLIAHAEQPVTKTVTVTAQGEGLAATQCCVPESIASAIITSACRDKP